MLSIIIPTLDAEARLPATLASLVPGVLAGLVKELIIVDGGSRDGTAEIAEAAGAHLMTAPRGRGAQLRAGGKEARGEWLLFLHADTMLEEGWEREVAAFIERSGNGQRAPAAAAFRFRLDDVGARPRLLEALVALRCLLFRLPYGDQGLLIPRTLYQEIGGYRDLALMEDVDLVRRIVRRIGRQRLVILESRAITSAERFRRSGYLFRSARNLVCLALYYLRIPPRYLAKLYG